MNHALSILQAGQFGANITGMDKQRFGDMVKRARDRKGWRSIDLGAALGRDGSFVSRLETGTFKETPAPDVLAALREHLGLDETQMLRALGYLQEQSETAPEESPDDLRDQLTAIVRQVRWREKPELAHSLITVARGILQDQENAAKRTQAGANSGQAR
jgi:transcriptional regulator with XRE-family HTH domain